MARDVVSVFFSGVDADGDSGLWVTDGTAAGTSELTGISGASTSGVNPFTFTLFGRAGSELLFGGADEANYTGLWVTNGTAAGTSELTGISGVYANGLDAINAFVFRSEVLFSGLDSALV